MRCKAPRVSEIIRSRYHRDPHNGDVYIFMSKDQPTGMSPEKMHRYIQFFFTQLEDIKEELRRANATIAENASEQKRLNALVLSLTNQLNDALQKIQNLLLENESLKPSLRVFKKQHFGSSSQKGIVKKEDVNDRGA